MPKNVKALAASTGKAVEEITTTVEDTSRIGRQRSGAPCPLGSLALPRWTSSTLHQSGVYALVRGAPARRPHWPGIWHIEPPG